MSAPATWWVVSDLHLGSVAAESRTTGAMFAAFLSGLEHAHGRERHLVLLGDVLELAGPEDPIERLTRLVVGQRLVFARLRACQLSGVDLHYVCGNHDPHMARQDVQTALTELTGIAVGGPDGLAVHPWFLYAPGVLYAEHGHQHHDLHRDPLILARPFREAGGFESPLSSWTSPMVAAGGLSRVLGRVRGTRRAMSVAIAAESEALSAGYRRHLRDQADATGLPIAVVAELATAGSVSWWGVATRLVGRRIRGLLRLQGRGPLFDAGARVAHALRPIGGQVPAYVFGHTHRAEMVSGRSSATYVNCGTWADVRGDGRDLRDPSLFPVVLLSVAEQVTIALEYLRAIPTPGTGMDHPPSTTCPDARPGSHQ